MCRLSRNLGSSASWHPLSLSRPVQELLWWTWLQSWLQSNGCHGVSPMLLFLLLCCFICFVFNYYIWPICCNFSVSVYRCFHNTLTSSCSHTDLCVCVCVRACLLSVVSMPRDLHIEYCKCAATLSCLINYFFFARTRHPEVWLSIVSSYCLHSRHLLSVSSLRILFLK
jgi:hypothetical protein